MPEHAQPVKINVKFSFITSIAFYLLSAVILEQNLPVKEIFSL
jgi:hypothetical protein